MARDRFFPPAALLLILSARLAAADVQFAPLAAPLSDTIKHQIGVSPSVTFGNAIGLGLDLLMRTGDVPAPGSTPFGQIFAADGSPVYVQNLGKDGKWVVTKEVDISPNPDFNSLHKTSDGKLWAISQFEYPRPGGIYLSELRQNATTGMLTALSTKALNLSAIGGVWTMCAGQVTPWNSHLGGEEYEPDARLIEMATSLDANETTSLLAMDTAKTLYPNVIEFMRFFGKYAGSGMTIADVKQLFNPYMYGHSVEVSVGAGGKTEINKWYTLGRNSRELAYFMPDNKTAYITDDGTNVGFFKFVADVPNNLSSGTMYAAKFTQLSGEGGGSFNITWIKLGFATNAELQAKASGLKFSDIFSYAAPNKTTGACPTGYTSINANDRLQECLQLKAGAEKWAAFFETRRYGSMLGATTEFSKWEGLTFSPIRGKIYTSMTEIRYGMEDKQKKGVNDTSYDIGGSNDVRLKYNKCGCVYVLSVDASYNAINMSALLCGTTQGLTDEDNACSVEGISNPDNISIMDEQSTLIIGEDTSDHQNDAMWAFNLNTGSLTRIATSPYGAETTSAYYYKDINGFAYIMAVVQHPYGESDEDMVDNPYSEGIQGYVSYFAIKAAAIAGKAIQFAGVPVPRTEETKSQFLGTTELVAGITSKAQYNTLFRSGYLIGGVTMGGLVDMSGKPIKAVNSTTLAPTTENEISDSPDHTTILQTCDAVHMVSQFENTPAIMFSMNLAQDPNNGSLSVSNPKVVDFSNWGGLWYACAGSPTPWQSHLGSEEYEPDAKTLALAKTLDDILADAESGQAIMLQMRYFGKYVPNITIDDVKALFKPYNYGHVTEVFVEKAGCTKAVKHFAMGRGSIEMAHVLGDNKTALISEDGQNDALYKFVADKAGDLSSGTLYAAKFTQLDVETPGGEFNVSWIKLGSGSDAALAAQAAKLTFTDIFALKSPGSTGTCPDGYKSVNTGYAGQECLQLKSGMEVPAAFLETRRYAALLGATTELNKAEGLAFDSDGKRAFLSITAVEKGMEDMAKKGQPSTKYDQGNYNDIRLEWNPCGCVYQLDLDANNSPTTMKALICGQPVNATEDFGNSCSLEGISSPDNVDYMQGTNTLLIGEDTDFHQNDVMWAYNFDTSTLTRVLSTPYGSEVTSPQYYPNVNGSGYIVTVVQHPYGESDQDKVTQPEATGKAGWVGYIGPLQGTGAAAVSYCNGGAGICPAAARKLRLA